MKYLITGGAGFIGSHLVDALTTRGDRVLILDDLSTGRRENLEHILDSELVDFVEGSVEEEGLVDGCVQDVDVCLHLASTVGVQLVVERPLDALQRNMRGNEVVLGAAARHRRRLLFASTSEVYGKNGGEALGEESDRVLGSPFKARWSYAISKQAGEALVHAYHRDAGREMMAVRLFNTVGPRQTGAYGMVLPRFVSQALREEELTVYGNGTQSRCFAHVLDVVHAILLLVDNDHAIGKVFNVGAEREMAVIELAGTVIERAHSDSRIRLVPYHHAYDEGFEELGRRRPDTSRLRELTGWEPTRTVEEAIDDVIAYERSVGMAVEGRESRFAR